MAELQTVAAVLDLFKLSYAAVKFFKKVKNADKIALEISSRVQRLDCVLKGVHAVLEERDDQEVSPGSDARVSTSILDAVLLCTETLKELQVKIGGFSFSNQQAGDRSYMERLKVALRSSSIYRLNGDLEARIHILSTELTVLQLFDHTKNTSTIKTNHDDLLKAINTLGTQVNSGNEILRKMLRAHNLLALSRDSSNSTTASTDVLVISNSNAVESLRDCLQEASNLHERFSERYTSDYLSDDRSERIRRLVTGDYNDSPLGASTPSIPITTPSKEERSPTVSITLATHYRPAGPEEHKEEEQEDNEEEEDDDEEVDAWPLEMLDDHIQAYLDRAHVERDAEHFSQAEHNLSEAIRSLEIRESRYGVPFVERVKMREEMAVLFAKQRMWAEAVTTVRQLMRENSQSASSFEGGSNEDSDLALAHQEHLLAQIYYDRYMSDTAGALNLTKDDLTKAESHARRAFNRRWKGWKAGMLSEEEAEEFYQETSLLVRILEAMDRIIEASTLKKRLEGSSCLSDGVKNFPQPSLKKQIDYAMIDKHDILVEAIKSRDIEQIQGLLTVQDLDLERLCRQGKTFLMHAVESKDTTVVHKLLDPEVGAYINTANRQGLTALHYAAMGGLHDMVQCLFRHDADVEPKDKKGETPIVKAVRSADLRMVEIFYNQDERSLYCKGGFEWNLIHYASERSSIPMINLLLELAPELTDALDQAGQTALHHCAEHTRIEQASALLCHQHAPDVNAIDSVSRTALFLAASKPSTPQREALVRLLLQKGAHIDERRPPPRMRDYVALKPRATRRDSTLSRTSVSTEGTVSTTSTSASRLSRMAGRIGSR